MNKDLEKQLEERGVYFTHLVKELITTLVKAKRPLSVEEILAKFNRKKFNPYKSSLYRQLVRLSGLGVVEESLFSDGIKRYCFIYERNHHHHFECNKCGYLENVPMRSCEGVTIKVSKKLKKIGHKITSHSFTLKGLCSKCT